ncbi:MAG: hypothetical protein ACXVEF_15930 [Polyangiales bacterium]
MSIVQRAVMRFAPVFALVFVGCTSAPPRAASPAPAASSTLGSGAAVDTRGPNGDHDAALGTLADAPWSARVDKRHTIALPLPDGPAWTHVKYWGVTTLAGWRYGDEHHVALAAFSYPPPGGTATVEVCAERFAAWGTAKAKQFDVQVGEPRIEHITWPDPAGKGTNLSARVFVVDARRRSLLGTKRYAAAYAIYPAWNDACLAVGFAVPERDSPDLARAVRDRLVRDALPALTVKPGAGALALEAKSDVDE